MIAVRASMRLVLAAMLVWACGAATAQPSPQAPTSRTLLVARDFAALEAIYAEQSSSKTRMDGEMATIYFFRAMGVDSKGTALEEENKATLAWLARSPGSVPASIARARASINHAVALEHSGDWPGAGAALREAERRLMDVKATGAADMTWHILYVEVAEKQGWPLDRVKRIVEEALQVDANSLLFYYAAGSALAPDPLQSPEPLDWLARRAAARTAQTHGASMYAIVRVWTARLNVAVESRPFSGGLMDWPLLNQGLAEHYRRTRNHSMLNHHAALACLARDKGVAAELLATIGTQVSRDTWKRWGASLYQDCKQWATS